MNLSFGHHFDYRVHALFIWVYTFYLSNARDTVVDVLVIPSTCIRGRDIVITPLVCVCLCVST